MSERSWSISSVLSRSIDLFKVHWAIVIGAMFILVILASIIAFGTQLLAMGWAMGATAVELDGGLVTTVSLMISVVGGLLQTFLSLFLVIGYFRLLLQVVRDERPSIRTLFTGLPNVLSALLAGLLITIGCAIGTILLIIPGIIFSIGMQFTIWGIADRNLGAVEAMKESWRLLKGEKLWYFGFSICCGLFTMLGYLACCVGVLATGPIASIAMAVAYNEMLTAKPPETKEAY